ncbi:MAG: hypothetical protein ACE5LL_08095 [Alphaproteobacteria bacterium]
MRALGQRPDQAARVDVDVARDDGGTDDAVGGDDRKQAVRLLHGRKVGLEPEAPHRLTASPPA